MADALNNKKKTGQPVNSPATSAPPGKVAKRSPRVSPGTLAYIVTSPKQVQAVTPTKKSSQGPLTPILVQLSSTNPPIYTASPATFASLTNPRPPQSTSSSGTAGGTRRLIDFKAISPTPKSKAKAPQQTARSSSLPSIMTEQLQRPVALEPRAFSSHPKMKSAVLPQSRTAPAKPLPLPAETPRQLYATSSPSTPGSVKSAMASRPPASMSDFDAQSQSHRQREREYTDSEADNDFQTATEFGDELPTEFYAYDPAVVDSLQRGSPLHRAISTVDQDPDLSELSTDVQHAEDPTSSSLSQQGGELHRRSSLELLDPPSAAPTVKDTASQHSTSAEHADLPARVIAASLLSKYQESIQAGDAEGSPRRETPEPSSDTNRRREPASTIPSDAAGNLQDRVDPKPPPNIRRSSSHKPQRSSPPEESRPAKLNYADPTGKLKSLAVGLVGCTVNENGEVVDAAGHVLGLVEGDITAMLGQTVSATGEVCDGAGDVAGRVARNFGLEDPAEEAPRVDKHGNMVDEDGNLVAELRGRVHEVPRDADAQGAAQAPDETQSAPESGIGKSDIQLDIKSTKDYIHVVIRIPTTFQR